MITKLTVDSIKTIKPPFSLADFPRARTTLSARLPRSRPFSPAPHVLSPMPFPSALSKCPHRLSQPATVSTSLPTPRCPRPYTNPPSVSICPSQTDEPPPSHLRPLRCGCGRAEWRGRRRRGLYVMVTWGASAEGMALVHSRGAIDWPGGSDRSRGKLGDGACVQRYRHCS